MQSQCQSTIFSKEKSHRTNIPNHLLSQPSFCPLTALKNNEPRYSVGSVMVSISFTSQMDTFRLQMVSAMIVACQCLQSISKMYTRSEMSVARKRYWSVHPFSPHQLRPLVWSSRFGTSCPVSSTGSEVLQGRQPAKLSKRLTEIHWTEIIFPVDSSNKVNNL